MQALTMILPGLRRILGITPLNLRDMVVVGGSAVLPLLINEITKLKEKSDDQESHVYL
jgi:Ca2+-transporting ATPase